VVVVVLAFLVAAQAQMAVAMEQSAHQLLRHLLVQRTQAVVAVVVRIGAVVRLLLQDKAVVRVLLLFVTLAHRLVDNGALGKAG
jgi:hypothetical protein